MTLRQFLDRYGATLVVVAGAAPWSSCSCRATPTRPDRRVARRRQRRWRPRTRHRRRRRTVARHRASAPPAAVAGGVGRRRGGSRRRRRRRRGRRRRHRRGEVEVGQGPELPGRRPHEGHLAVHSRRASTFSGDNGGATAKGVTKDKILVVRFLQPDRPGDLGHPRRRQARRRPRGRRSAPTTALFDATATHHYQTYGREVVLPGLPRPAADDSNDEAMKADALKIANDIKPFAVIEGTRCVIPTVFAKELAARGVICICTIVAVEPSSTRRTRPTSSARCPPSTEYAQPHRRVHRQAAGRTSRPSSPATSSTQPGCKTTNRKFGLIYLEGTRAQARPRGQAGAGRARRRAGQVRRQLGDGDSIAYMYDPGRNQQDVTTMMATLKDAGVTTVILFVDPLYPILFTTEATAQNYFPSGRPQRLQRKATRAAQDGV